MDAERACCNMNVMTEETIEYLKEILEGSFDGILVTDGKGNVLLVNRSYVRNTGLTKEELLGHNVRELINPVWMKNSVALLAIEQRHPVSMRHSTRNGKDIIVTGTPLFSPDKEVKMVVVNTRDMSEINELQEELQKMKKMEKIYQEQLRMNSFQDEDMLSGEIIVGNSKMQQAYLLAGKVAPFDVTVLITGESGVGKELVARYLHRKSLIRSKRNFVAINCAAIPENLLESELFGYAEGAFTGAGKGGKPGLFEAANGGTLFLDEIGEIDLELQAKLLRALEAKTITRVGSNQPISLDIRIVAATNRNLLDEVAAGRFREDLYYRLNVVSIKIPPLRERLDEVGALAMQFVAQYNAKYRQEKKLTYDVIREFEKYDWKGNIRELKNVVENMVLVSNHEYLQTDDIPWLSHADRPDGQKGTPTLAEMLAAAEREILTEAKKTYGSSRKIAAALGAEQSTIVRKLKKHQI